MSIRRKKFFYYKRIKIKSSFSGQNARCGEQLKASTVNLRQGCQLVSICSLGYPFLSEAHLDTKELNIWKKAYFSQSCSNYQGVYMS